ncbi:MAG: hypothetical protein RMK74_08160, partial [Myxococcales bacterium]|nr:hypothetical protein [Myxococcales bacterium]
DDGVTWSGDPLNPGMSYLVGAACAEGLGVCRRGGVVVCTSGGAADCDAVPGTPTGETCNYLDDDCNGVVDNGFVDGMGRYTGDRHCGACGVDCTAIYALPGAFGTCQLSGSGPRCVMNCNPGRFNLNGIPDDGCEFTLDTGAIYVSAEDPTGRDADNAGCGLGPVGTGAGHYPCSSIGYGILRAMATGRTRVLVADALYNENVTLVAGISLYGGYRADTWERHLSTTLTTIRGTSGSGHRRTVTATGISTATVFEGFIVDGADASSPGANSYAIYVSGGTSALQILNNVIYAGNGAPGSPGSAGTDGLDGVDGSAGANAFDTGSVACTISRSGGAGGIRTCGSTNVSGGAGGGVFCPPFYDTNPPYTPGSARAGAAGAGPAGGAGGAVAYDGQTRPADTCLLCYLPGGANTMTGGNGAHGGNGSHGTGGSGASHSTGSIIGGDWIGASGANGVAGNPGSGGGGGASGGGGDGSGSPCTDDLGATGGGGGSGACGGTAGGGGGPGGGSFGIFITGTSSRPVLSGNTIYRGFGGAGGNGGRGGAGGIGGSGGNGGLKCNTTECFCTGDGGTGGDGGDGGHGGGGGGGAGGVSYGIFAEGTTGYGATTNTFPVSGGGGPGGGGGPSIGNSGTAGVAGAHAPTN